MQDARENLNNVKYSQRDGIQLLHDNMMEYAGGMAVFPDDYILLSIFFGQNPRVHHDRATKYMRIVPGGQQPIIVRGPHARHTSGK